jgi:hypothetical protein
MAVHAFEWKKGPSDNPEVVSFCDDLVIEEAASEAFLKGTPLVVDLSGSGTNTVQFKTSDADLSDLPLIIAATDAVTGSSDVDLTQPGTNAASLPYINRPGDIWSVTLSSSGANLATSGDHFGQICGWIFSTESGETKKAVLDLAQTTDAHWVIVGFDDRDAMGTSGGRVLAMYQPGMAGTLTEPSVT